MRNIWQMEDTCPLLEQHRVCNHSAATQFKGRSGPAAHERVICNVVSNYAFTRRHVPSQGLSQGS